MMSWDIFGYIGTIIILYSFIVENIYKLRFINSIGSVFWIIYGFGILAWPTVIVNSCILLIHTIWFIKHRKEWRS
jgi:hypothetical protein